MDGRTSGQRVKGLRRLKLKFTFSMPQGGRNLAYCQQFLGSFEIGPTQQVFLLNRYPFLEIGLSI